MNNSVDNASITQIDETLIKTVYKNKALVNAVHLEKIREKYSEMTGSDDLSKLRLMVVFEAGLEISRDIGERYLTSRVRPKVGEAFVSNDPGTREYLNAASALMKKSHPVQVFSDESSAKDWLMGLG